MHHHHRNPGNLRHLQKAVNGLRLQHAGPGAGVGIRPHEARFLPLLNERVNDVGIFAVDARDAAVFLHLLQGQENIPVADHHGRIGQVHFERGNSLPDHLRDFGNDLLVPVVDGHVEAVVAGRPARSLFVPQIQAVLQALALVGAGEVNDHGGAAQQRGAAAGFKVVRRGGIAHVEIKMGMCVDKAGKQQHPAAVHAPGVRRRQLRADAGNLLSVDQQICRERAAACDNGAAL